MIGTPTTERLRALIQDLTTAAVICGFCAVALTIASAFA